MTLQLDARQRAMLQEMGIRVFLPAAQQLAEAGTAAVVLPARPAATPVTAAPRAEAEARAEPAARSAPPAQGLPELGALDWDALQQAARGWAQQQGGQLVWGVGDPQPRWLCVGDPPDEEEAGLGQPFPGERGRLLDNMLKALGASRAAGAYLTPCWKWPLPQGRSPTPMEAAWQQALLRREVQLLRPAMILAMGRFAVQSLVDSQEPLGRLRGRVHRFDGIPVVVTYPPAYLLRNLQDKAKAWADLCLAQAALRQDGQGP